MECCGVARPDRFTASVPSGCHSLRVPPRVAAGGYGGQGYGPPPGQGYGQPPHRGANPEFLYGAPGQVVSVGVPSPEAQAAPPNPYAPATPMMAAPTRGGAVLQGPVGVYTVLPGQEVRAGRDPGQCGIVLSEPRVSSVHASLKLENGVLLVKDENSNNGTVVNGSRISPGVWAPVQSGGVVRFGPVEFNAQIG
jgi:hypothetical protein